MDTGLKRLWARRKSKGNDSRKDSGVSSLRKSESNEQTHYSTSTSPRSIRNVSSSHVTQQFGPLLNTKAPPIFKGGNFSRPSTSRSRPATDASGSMLNAVHRAGDAIAKAEQEYQNSAERYTKDHIRPKTPRYIDIFSLSSSNSPNPGPGYNEYVAERNLDLTRVALEGTHYHYSPSSRYQEEVAARNASPHLLGSPAISPSLRQRDFDGSHSPSQVGGLGSALSDYSRSPERSGNHSLSRQYNHTPESLVRHLRQRSDTSRASESIDDLVAHGESAASPPHLQRVVALQGSNHGLDAVHTLPEVPARHPGRRSGEFQNLEMPADGLSGYQLSASELTQMKSIEPFTYPPRPDYSVRSPSNLSSASSMMRSINLPNRTIMDLTSDDTEILAERPRQPTYRPSVVDCPKVDDMQAAQKPVAVRSSLNSTDIQPDSDLSASLPPAITAPPISAEISELDIDRKPPSNHHFANRFTPIITIASASPRTSVVMKKSSAPSAAQETQQNVDANGSHGTVEARAEIHRRLSSGEETPEEESHVSKTAISPSKESNSQIASGEDNDVGHQSLEATINQEVHLIRDTESQPVSGPYVHLSSGNTMPIIDASGTPTVIARDFATIATKSPLTSVPEDVEIDDKGNVPSAAAGTKTRPRKSSLRKRESDGHTQVTPNQSTFDEAEFAQKQVEMREALVRLQLSLNETFLTHPTPTPVVQSNRSSPSKHIYSFSDGRPAAPSSSILSQMRESSPNPPNPKAAETEDSTGVVDHKTSYHNLTTVAQKHEPMRARSGSLKHSMANTEKKRDKGKQRAETELNGPGPSVLNDAPKQPLPPLPPLPPFHLADDPFVHRFPQPQAGVPRSPGEISLSHFPIPVSSPKQSAQKPTRPYSNDQERITSRPASQNAVQRPSSSGGPGMKERILRRKSSTKSQASSTSQFSIPYHMIPDRSSSIRDRSVMEDDDG